MVFKIVAISVLFLSASCSTSPTGFSKNQNCSSRALEKVKQTTPIELAGPAGVMTFKAGQSCYNSAVSEGYNQTHNVCVVIEVSKSGGINFIDVNDNDNSLSTELRNCIINRLSAVDFRDYVSSTILQPIKLGNE